MGVDSGLPDYRGAEGFWNAPPLRDRRLRWIDLANPEAFRAMPERAWGFYGSRLDLYRRTRPHEGFRILRRWAEAKQSSFVYTSNVDGQFLWRTWQQRAGFDRLYPLHAIRHSAVTNVYRKTRDLYLAQRFARHASPRLTTTVYTHPSDEEIARQIRSLSC